MPPTTVPARPLQVSIGAVRCPGRMVAVTVRNIGPRTEDYAIEQNGSATIADRIAPGASRTRQVELTEGRATNITVTWKNAPVRSAGRTANCAGDDPAPPPGNDPPEDRLPHTGPEDGVLTARIATGVAAMITGGIILWWGGLWPRRRERIFQKD
ncbi:hypothetical protein DPM19_08425 [Actinomadura craniellae]|uniref:Uncharacterized protein n=1 Tax=Actinomadura craniellae TaxID=2231787 RepID=A0A365H9V7_9ACTN|nr:hypothetical protein DPM19_08425 [Actinomadura craniellae]